MNLKGRIEKDYKGATSVYDEHMVCGKGTISWFSRGRQILMFSYINPIEPVGSLLALIKRLKKIGCELVKDGDSEFVVHFHTDLFPKVKKEVEALGFLSK